MIENRSETPAPSAPSHTTTIIEKRSSGGVVILAIIGLALLLAVGYFFMESKAREDAKSEAVIGAAKSVDDAATRIGDAAKSGVDTLKNE